MPEVALAAGGIGGHDRASVRVTAHTFGLAGVCRVWWAPEVKSRASGGACAASGLAPRMGGPAAWRRCVRWLRCSARVRAPRCLVAVLLVVAFVLDLSSRRLRKRNLTGLVV